MQWLLRGGLAIASLLMVGGLIYAGVKGRLRAHEVTFGQFIGLIRSGHPSGWLAAGIFILLATPIARVLALVVGFSLARDWRFAAVATTVAVMLVVAIALGRT